MYGQVGYPGMGCGTGAYAVASAGTGGWFGIGAVIVGTLILIALLAVFVTAF